MYDENLEIDEELFLALKRDKNASRCIIYNEIIFPTDDEIAYCEVYCYHCENYLSW